MSNSKAITSTQEQNGVVDWLSANDAACPVCEYALRSIPTPTCPECGMALALTIDAPGVSHRPWVTAVIAVALGLGFDAVFSFILGVVIITNPPPPGINAPYVVLASIALAALLSIVGLAIVLATRRRWLRRRTRVQWRWTALTTAGVLTLHAVIGGLLFDYII